MEEYSESLVIGKFYPPHLGHHYLIDTAISRSKHVTVLVVGTHFDSVALETRVQMIRDVHRGSSITVTPVLDYVYDDYNSESVWKAHNTIISNHLTVYPDALFTSEDYGDELADYFKADHIIVDMERKHYPISATAIRKDLYKQWRYLHPKVRDNFRLKIVVMGAESTGITTLAKALRKQYSRRGGVFTDTPLVPSYADAYIADKLASGDPELTASDFWMMATGQENSYAVVASTTKSPLIISEGDTVGIEALAPYYGVRSGEKAVSDYGHFDAIGNPGDIYLITDHEGVSVPTGIDANARVQSTQSFISTCQSYKLPYALISGNMEERLVTATGIIDRLMKMNSFMRSPIYSGK